MGGLARRPGFSVPGLTLVCNGGPIFRRPFFFFFGALFFFWRPSVLAQERKKERKKRGDAYVERAGPQAPKGVLGCNTQKP